MTSSEMIAILVGLVAGYFVVQRFIGESEEKHSSDRAGTAKKDHDKQ